MNNVSSHNVQIIDAWHVAIATDDIDGKVRCFWQSLGVGPWSYLSITCTNTSQAGREPQCLTVEAAMTQVGFLRLGYDMPLIKPSPFDDIIRRRGGGAHHLAFLVGNYDDARKYMLARGYAETLHAGGIGPNGDGMASYFDAVADMGTTIEFSKITPAHMPEITRTYPPDGHAGRAGNIELRGTTHVAIAVRDVEEAARRYADVLGIGPWSFSTVSGPVKYRGVDIDYAVKTAVGKAGSYVLCLEQPLSNVGPLQEFLPKYGPGIHHVCFAVDDVREASHEMQKFGYEEILSVPGVGPNLEGGSVYFDTDKAVGIMIELTGTPSEMG